MKCSQLYIRVNTSGTCGLMILFFVPCSSFRIVNGTSSMVKGRDDTSAQKLTEVYGIVLNSTLV